MEHNAYDIRALRDCLQYLLNRGQIAKSGSVAPAVTPMVRIPPNGMEKAQWHAKQAFDLGAYGIIWPHISSVEEAYNAVSACRFPRLKSAPRYEPAGVRGDGPTQADPLLGHHAAGLLRTRRRLALRSQRRDLRHPDDGGHQGHRGIA